MFPVSGEEFHLNLCTHDTAEILSHQIAGLSCFKFAGSTVSSSASQCINIPNILRSEMAVHHLNVSMSPLYAESSFLVSFGHVTVGYTIDLVVLSNFLSIVGASH